MNIKGQETAANNKATSLLLFVLIAYWEDYKSWNALELFAYAIHSVWETLIEIFKTIYWVKEIRSSESKIPRRFPMEAD